MQGRYTITLGAATSAGGKVTSADDFKTIEGLAVAREGDTCWCPVCQSEGVIGLAGPRMSTTIDGREIALDGDLCLCACTPPPRLLAAQQLKSQSVDGEQYALDAAAAVRAAADLNTAAIAPQDTDKLPLVFIDPDSGEPLQHHPYRLEVGTEVIEGVLDAQGWTEPLSAAQRAAVLAWQVD
jgi:uncharacterized Zn-binding protein involved in type VI secretion